MAISKEGDKVTSPGSTLSTCTFHCTAVELGRPVEDFAAPVWPESWHEYAPPIITIRIASSNNAFCLFALTRDLHLPFFDGPVSTMANMCPLCHQLVSENLSLPFV